MASIIARAAWNARSPRGGYTSLPEARGVKVHYTGGHVDVRIVDDHDICLRIMRQIQNHHMDGNGWMDFAYNMAGCPHGRMIMGRGPRILSAANGAGLNQGHYAVLALLGTTGYRVPTPGLLTAVRDCIDYLRKNGAGTEIKGHRDGYATDCPGPRLYEWVRAGAPRPEEDDVSAKDVWSHELPVPWGSEDNPEWQARSIIINSNQRLRSIEAKLDAQNATIAELAKALGERDGVDVDALVSRITEAIERVTVRLDVAE